MTTLVSDLNVILEDLQCMGRALDIHKRHPDSRLRRLFRQNTLPANVQQLVSRRSFRHTYRIVFHHLDQLQRSVGFNEGPTATAGACELWLANRASVLVYSLTTAIETESFVDDVSSICSTLR